MTIQAQLEPKRQPRGSRQDPRRKLRLLTSARSAKCGPADVLVLIHDLSTSGMLVRTDALLEPGEKIEVQLPGTGSRQAEVVWSGGTFVGCSFAEPIPPATVSAALLKGLPGAPAEQGSARNPDAPDIDFANRLAALRSEHGWTIEQLADRLGVSRQAVWYWETGQRLPRAGLFRKIADEFGVMERDLLVDENRPGTTGVAGLVGEFRKQIAASLGCDEAKVRISIDL
jgi:transcriptional regulator with XRE-family HTH domain